MHNIVAASVVDGDSRALTSGDEAELDAESPPPSAMTSGPLETAAPSSASSSGLEAVPAPVVTSELLMPKARVKLEPAGQPPLTDPQLHRPHKRARLLMKQPSDPMKLRVRAPPAVPEPPPTPIDTKDKKKKGESTLPAYPLGSFPAALKNAHYGERKDMPSLDSPAMGSSSLHEDLTDEGKQRVKSINQSYQWFFHYCQKVKREQGSKAISDLLQLIAVNLPYTPVSTAFSGVHAPGTALEVIRMATSGLLGLAIPPAPHTMAVECYSESCYELSMHPHSPVCMFSNISDFYADPLKKLIDKAKANGEAVSYNMLKPVILSGKAMKAQAHCLVHGRECKANIGKHHEAGSTCVDWSVQGSGGREEGPTMEHTMAWIGLIRLLQPATWAHENVKGFPAYILKDNLSDLYEISEALCASQEFGWPDMRERVIRCGRHRMKAPTESMPWAEVSELFHRSCEVTWQDLFCSTPCDIADDLAWAILRKQKYLARAGLHTHQIVA
jgi:hypothetical protein